VQIFILHTNPRIYVQSYVYIYFCVPSIIYVQSPVTYRFFFKIIIYPVASITGFCTICSSLWFEIMLSDKSNLIKFLYFVLLVGIFPLLSIYGIDFATPINLITENVGEAFFGWVFGICIGVGFKILLPKKIWK